MQQSHKCCIMQHYFYNALLGAGTVARTEAELAEQLQMALAQQEGPWLIEAVFNRGGASL